jgi:hypothetical protein
MNTIQRLVARTAVMGGMAALLFALAGAGPVRADDDYYARRDDHHIYRDVADVRRDEARLRDLERRRAEERRERDWDHVRRLDRQITDLRWHIDHDRRDIRRDIDHARRDRNDYR